MEEKFINFLKETELYNEEVLEYIKPNTVKVDYSPEAIDFIGCFPVTDENNKLRAIRMCVPKMIDDITVAINIHEYVHLLMIYRSLNKEYEEPKDAELMPVYYELAYLKENNLDDYLNYYLEHIKEQDNYLRILLDIFAKDDNKIKEKKHEQ